MLITRRSSSALLHSNKIPTSRCETTTLRLRLHLALILTVGKVIEIGIGIAIEIERAWDQWLRASQSIPLTIAEGNGKTAEADRRRYFEIARGSALECAAIQDVLVVCKALDEKQSHDRKHELDRMAAMLGPLGNRGYAMQEESAGYGIDSDWELSLCSVR